MVSAATKLKDNCFMEEKLTNLNSLLKADITLLTKLCIVKAMVFPVVMYTCEIWTIKKTGPKGLLLSNCDAGEDS